jgi:hypothetical protein
VYVEEPLWHLDTAINTTAQRRAKAVDYERQRRGMRIGAYSHNTAIYLPELRGPAALRTVPSGDAESIDHVMRGIDVEVFDRAQIEHAGSDQISIVWPGPPYATDFYNARIALRRAAPPILQVGLQQTIDVRVANLGSARWCSEHVTLGTHWPGGVEGIRTRLPADIAPGMTALVPLHVLAPVAGRQLLEIDLVHEHVRWFGAPLRLEVDAVPARRVLVAGDGPALAAALDAIALAPQLEPVIVESGEPDTGHPTVEDPATALFGTAGTDSALAALRAVLCVARALFRGRLFSNEFIDAVVQAEHLVVAGYAPGSGVAETRQRLGVVTIALMTRAAGALS